MSVSFMHDFHSKVLSIENIGPSINDMVPRIDNGLIKVESVKVESHSANAQASKPNTNHRPSCQEKVKGPTVIE